MVTPSPVLTVKTAPGIKHVSVRRFYLGPAFEMFALHVTLLPQSCRSARLLFLLRCSLSPPRPPPLYLYQPLFLSRSLPLPLLLSPRLLMRVSVAAQLIAYSCCMRVISS